MGRLVTVLAATAAGVLAWAVEVGLGVDLHAGATKVTPAAVVIVGLLVGGLGWLLLALLERLSRARGRTVWTVVAVVVLVLSLAGPLGATTAAGKVSLACLHLLVGGVLIAGLGLRRSSRVAIA